ncbi:unnamed protein product [Prunus armeniaca]
MPGNEKPLAAIIEGRWYSIEKNDRPTMELTRTQKRTVQRQYCTFLNNKSNAQMLPETNSARKGKKPEMISQTEQAISQPQKKTSIHPASTSGNLLKTPQPEGKSDPIPVKGQEDWTEEYEEEQLDYEPSADDQDALLEIGEQGEWTEEYGEEQMDYGRELDAETKAFAAELEDLLQGDLGINMVFILLEKFWAAEG